MKLIKITLHFLAILVVATCTLPFMVIGFIGRITVIGYKKGADAVDQILSL